MLSGPCVIRRTLPTEGTPYGSSGHDKPVFEPRIRSSASGFCVLSIRLLSFRGEGKGHGRAVADPGPSRSEDLKRYSVFLGQLGGLLLDVLETTAHEERLLRGRVVVTVGDLVEGLNRLRERHGRTLDAGELLGDVGVLRQEALDPASAVDEDLVLFGELVDAEDRDDV